MPSREQKAGWSAALIFGLCSSASLAADEREPIRLFYAADAGCPPAPDFEASVLERASRARPARPGEIAREYRVRVRAADRGTVARLEFAASGGGTASREVSAGDCAEAVRAIAVVTALAFDAAVAGAAAGTAGAPTTEVTEPPPVEPPPAPAPSPLPAAPPAAPPVAPKPAAPSSTPREPARDTRPDVPRSEPKEPSGFGVGARVTLASAKAPQLMPGAELFAQLGDRRARWSLQLGAAGERSAWIDLDLGEARFSFVGGRAEVCRMFALDATLELGPCALVEGGAVLVEGVIEGERRVVDPWVALGLNVRVAWELGPATALLEAGPIVPLMSEDRVVFGDVANPREVVHDVPGIGAFAALGVAFAVP